VKPLPLPVRKVLRAGVDPVTAARVWRRIEAERARAVRVPGVPASFWRPLALVAALSGVVAAAFVFAWWAGGSAARFPAAGPLRLADGRDIAAMTERVEAPRSFVLTDGSFVALGHGARLDVLENDGRALVTHLAQGEAHFDVQPGGPRRWTIECGAAAVEVVGTRFAITRAEGRVRVAVEHGIVLVRGEGVADHVRRLTDGETLDVGAASPAPSAPVETALSAPALNPSPTALPPAPPNLAFTPPHTAPSPSLPPKPSPGDASMHVPSPSAAAPTWRDLAQQGDYAQAYAMLGPDGIGRVTQSGATDELLSVADVARLSGHPRDAVAPLRRIVDEHAGEPGAAVAAFTLGRLELDALDDPPGAADAFARAIAIGIPQGLLEDAYARLVEARARAGDASGAARAADAYRERFPHGARAAAVERWGGRL